MKKIFYIIASVLIFLPLESKELENCKWKNESGTPCLNIFSAPNIIIAGGVGSFEPRKLSLKEAEKFEGKQIFYSVTNKDLFKNKKNIYIWWRRLGIRLGFRAFWVK